MQDLDHRWTLLLDGEASRSRTLNAKIRQCAPFESTQALLSAHLRIHRLKEELRIQFADLANAFQRELQIVSSALAAVGGPLEVSRICMAPGVTS